MQEEFISSKQNAKVKNWRKLKTAKGRKQQGLYMIEGEHLIEEAVRSGVYLEAIILNETYEGAYPTGFTTYRLAAHVFESLAETDSPQGILAILGTQSRINAAEDFQQLLAKPGDAINRWLLVDGVQDPGNLGTIIRTADAAGYRGVVLGTGTVDLYNDKVLRSTQGSHWHIEVVELPIETAMQTLQGAGIPVLATALHREARDYRTLDYAAGAPLALVVGNEGQGVQAKLIEQANLSVFIPMPGQAESLNVAVATGILLFAL